MGVPQSLYDSVMVMSLGHGIGIAVSGCLIYFLLVILYRLTFHPLAKYPGPFWQKVSDWPLVFHCHSGNRHLIELRNHEKYGKIVRYGPNSLSISTVTALQALHGAKANIKKGEWYKTLDISAGAASVQMMIDKHEHAIRRRTLAPAFSERALKDAEDIITFHARKLTDRVGSLPKGTEPGNWTPSTNMGLWATYFGFDFVGDLGYGSSFEMLEKDEYRWIPQTLMRASRFLYYAGYLPFISLVRPLMGTSLQSFIGGQEAADSLKYTLLANQRLADRMELEEQMRKNPDATKKAERKDTFHYLLNSKDSVTGKTFTTEELQADSALIIAAGSDGVGLTLSATIFYLLRNPTALSRLTQEVRSAFSSASDIQNPKLGSLPYLTACLDETLRMCPPKASSLPREVLAGGITIDGEHYPPGTTLGTPIYVLHHDSDIYPNPWSYIPERWIADKESVAAARSAFCPFIIGPMNCIGKKMAYIALKQALAHLLWRYDMRQAGEETGGGGKEDHLEEGRRRVDEYQMVDYILGFRDGPVVQFRDRTFQEI